MISKTIIVACAAASLVVPAIANTGSGLVILGGISSESGSAGRVEQGYRAPVSKPTLVDLATSLPPGSVVIRTKERKLYLVQPQGKA